ncbi:hypothetical protein SNE40_022186 [Patella caerulea]|uniref:HECT domain-containing protein n=1 Tax=Patella caerulea TaxID=87958 RepID=A0AAN8GC63_PATCE
MFVLWKYNIVKNDELIVMAKNQTSCPICKKSFEKEEIEIHAALCGDVENNEPQPPAKTKPLHSTLQEAIEILSSTVYTNKTQNNISVIRRIFMTTAMQQLADIDWNCKLNICFIGEEGLDSGGLGREFFSLFFKQTPLFDSGAFTVNSEYLEKKQYVLLGKIVAIAILHGHAGPQSLHPHITDYILSMQEPDFNQIPLNVVRADVRHAIDEITTSTNMKDQDNMYVDLLEMAGFLKLLTAENKNDAVLSLKTHYAFYKFLPPILQFIEGLTLHNVLTELKNYSVEGKKCLQMNSYNDAAPVIDFYKPSYSKDENLKQKEEVCVYNFHQFLRKLQRGKICSKWVSLEDDSEEDVVLHLGHFLQAAVGSPTLPRDIICGLLIFDHSSKDLTTVNTCAPSITFKKIDEIQTYDNFEDSLINIIVCAYGFGIE